VRKFLFLALIHISIPGCATLTEDAMTPVAISFSDGSDGSCQLDNKRGSWSCQIPTTVSVRKSDDPLKYRCKTQDGREASGEMPSEMGGKIIASAVFLDFGITDAITDKHRRYAPSYVVPMPRASDANPAAVPSVDSPNRSGTPEISAATAAASAPRTIFCQKQLLHDADVKLKCNWGDTFAEACSNPNDSRLIAKAAVIAGPTESGSCSNGNAVVVVTHK